MLKAPLDSAAGRKANPGAILNVSLVYLACFSCQNLDGHLANWHDRKHRKGYNHNSIKPTQSFLTWLLSSFVLIQKRMEQQQQQNFWLLYSLNYWFICSTGNNPRRHGSGAFLFSETNYPWKTSRLLVCLPALFSSPLETAKFLSSLNCHCVEVILIFFSLPLSYVLFNLESSSGTVCTSQLLSARIKHTALYC